MVPSVVTTMPMVECSAMTFRVPISAASVMGISWSNQGVVTIRGASSSVLADGPLHHVAHAVDEPHGADAPSGSWIWAASSGTNLGSAVMMVRPEPLWGSSSRARSFR